MMSLQIDLSYSVVHLTMRRGKTELATGTAFIYLKDDKYYLVTAWHNLTGRHSESLKPLHSRGALPDNLIAHMPMVAKHGDTIGYVRLPVRFDIQGDDGYNYWVHGTQWPRVDVAVMPFEPWNHHHHEMFLSDGTTREWDGPLFSKSPDGDLSRLAFITDTSIQGDLSDMLSSEEVHVEVGEDIFVLGFPKGIVDYSMTPLWKRASIATLSGSWERQAKFLVDCASREGMSGGPAIYFDRRGDVPMKNGSMRCSAPVAMLCGVYVGRVGDSAFGAQVGVVWNKGVIDEIIRDRNIAHRSEDLEESPAAVRTAINDVLAKCTTVLELNEESYAIGYMTYEVMATLEGRANPDYVRAEMICIIKQRQSTSIITGDLLLPDRQDGKDA